MTTNNPFEITLRRYLSEEQLKKVQSTHIGIAGAGGLGSNIAVMLVRSGFKHLEILDRDAVDPSNLNRQDFTTLDVARPKVDALRSRLLAINPSILVVTHKAEWTKGNADAFFTGLPILVEAFDEAQTKRDFVEWAATRAKFVVSGNGMAGLSGGNVTEIQRIGNIYLVGDKQSDIHQGLPALAPRVIQCAAKMAEIILNVTIEIDIT